MLCCSDPSQILLLLCRIFQKCVAFGGFDTPDGIVEESEQHSGTCGYPSKAGHITPFLLSVLVHPYKFARP